MTAIGLLGGTFDPIHKGHLQLAEVVLATWGLERILFIPAAVPPHKIGRTGSAIKHRLQMVHLAVAHQPGCMVSDLEASPGRPSYTIETMTALRAGGEERTEYFFIIGGDAFLEIETWYCWRELLQSTSFIVAIRQGYPLQDLQLFLKHHGFTGETAAIGSEYHGRHGNEVRLLIADIADISSTDIRQRIAEGRPWRHLVPETVATYIDEHNLYHPVSPVGR